MTKTQDVLTRLAWIRIAAPAALGPGSQRVMDMLLAGDTLSVCCLHRIDWALEPLSLVLDHVEQRERRRT
jgi:hypothetical protein